MYGSIKSGDFWCIYICCHNPGRSCKFNFIVGWSVSHLIICTLTEIDKDDGSGFDAKVFALAFGLAHIPLFTGIAVAIIIGVYCCYFKRKKGSADLAALSEKGGLVILDDKLLRAKEEGRLTVNVAILDNGKVYMGDIQ